MITYTNLTETKKKIQERNLLKEIVEQWWKEKGLWVPPFLSMKDDSMSYGVFVRQIATFRYEDAAFLLLAERGGLKPIWLEYTLDRFAASSPYKRSLVKRNICGGCGRNGGYRLKVDRLANINDLSGSILSEIDTVRGEKLVVFHHSIFDQFVGEGRREDLSSWLKAAGNCAQEFYSAFFSLFVAHCILFENYEEEENGKKSSELYGVVQSAFRNNIESFGVEPMIVAMPTWKDKFAFYPQRPDWRDDGVLTWDDFAVPGKTDCTGKASSALCRAAVHINIPATGQGLASEGK